MPRYVMIAEHTPDICPSSNARSRARAIKGLGPNLPQLSAEAGITFVTGPLHSRCCGGTRSGSAPPRPSPT